MRKHVVVGLALGAIFLASPVTAGSQVDPSAASCTPVKKVYAEKNWRDRTPQDGREVCWRAASPFGAARTIEHFKEYRRYRLIATMRCLSGSEGYFVPNPGSCSTLSCESGLSWNAVNASSGAEWAYQLLGGHTYPTNGYVRGLRGRTVYGGPTPNSFHNRLINHEIAGTLGRSAWTC